MRYKSDHRDETRARMIKTAARLAKTQGFAATGVGSFMAASGLTPGALYGHFDGKSDLMTALVADELTGSIRRLTTDLPTDDPLTALLAQYLSLTHLDQPGQGCVLPTLGAEIARSGGAAKSAFEAFFQQFRAFWGHVLGSEPAATALLAQCVGAILLARLCETRDLQAEILSACRHFLSHRLAGTAGCEPGPAYGGGGEAP